MAKKARPKQPPRQKQKPWLAHGKDLNQRIALGLPEAMKIISVDDKGIYEHVAQNGGQGYVKRQIEKALNDSPAAMSNEKRIIRYRPGDRHIVTNERERALIAAQCPVFYRGGVLVEPVWRWEKTAEKNRDALVTMLLRLNLQRLSYTTAKYAAIYHKYDGRTKKWAVIDPPKEVMEQLIERGHWDVPTVKGIVNSPTMRPDGSLLIQPGYDRTTQLWYKPAGDLELPIIPERPTQDDAQRALMLLTHLLIGFPFKDQVSKSVAVAGLLTAVLRGAFECAPLFLVLAPEPGFWQELPGHRDRDDRHGPPAPRRADVGGQERVRQATKRCRIRGSAHTSSQQPGFRSG
ncbi:hypothetical protein [Bradyrhizobium sp. RDM4]|uniref:hypothetical protein n=1 Tax=Bradyrhizobium sp. RDM4 TaxID=3378765 RepID=UPI0038FC3268